jgi:hypothetical protein
MSKIKVAWFFSGARCVYSSLIERLITEAESEQSQKSSDDTIGAAMSYSIVSSLSAEWQLALIILSRPARVCLLPQSELRVVRRQRNSINSTDFRRGWSAHGRQPARPVGERRPIEQAPRRALNCRRRKFRARPMVQRPAQQLVGVDWWGRAVRWPCNRL